MRKIYYIIIIIFTLISLFYSITGKNGVLKIIQLKHEIAEIREETEKINRENELLQTRIDLLKKDRRMVEYISRDELGMVREDEVLILFNKER